MNKEVKKTQIGIFIIIAIIIIIIGIFSISLFSGKISIFRSNIATSSINQYVKSCLQIETQNAVNLLGKKGGWLYPKIQSSLLYASSSTPQLMVPYAKGLNNFGVLIPYWFYYNQENKNFDFNIPQFQSITNSYSINNQLAKYINLNLEQSCLKHFQSFSKLYNVKYEANKINVSVNFQSSNIYVSLNLPIQINVLNNNQTYFINKFTYEEKNNPLKVPYFISRDIVYSEANYSFIEKRVLEFMNPYMSASSRNLLPPIYDLKLKYDPAPWYISNIRNLTKNIISSNIGLIQFQGTKTQLRQVPKSLENNNFSKQIYKMYDSPYIESQMRQTEKQVGQNIINQYSNYQIQTIFNTFFPFNFELTPSYGNVLYIPKARALLSKIIPIFMTTYSTSYKMTFPVMFQIRNPNNLNSKFSFDFVVEANIAHNQPLAENKDIVLPKTTKVKNTNSLICDPSQFISSYITLNISDPIGNGKRTKISDPIKGVAGARVSFNCKGLSTCYLGLTTDNGPFSSFNITKLRFRLPIDCNPGTLKIEKFGYIPIIINNLNPQISKSITYNKIFYMYSKKNMTLQIKLLSPSSSINSIGRSIGKNEKGFIIFKNLNAPNLISIVQINQSNQNSLKISLAPGKYDIQGILLYTKTILIPSENIDGHLIKAINLSSWIIGSNNIKTSISLSKLMYNNKIIVPMTYFDIPKTFSQMQSLSLGITNQENLQIHFSK